MPEHACVPTRDWPNAKDDFLAWLDAVKKNLRLRSDLQLATRLGIGHTLISGWRRDRQRPSYEALLDVAHALDEDPRKLWVLAGLVSAIDVGLLDGDAHPDVGPDLPEEMAELLDVYRREDLGEEDRAAILRHVRLLTLGVLADLDVRQKSEGVS